MRITGSLEAFSLSWLSRLPLLDFDILRDSGGGAGDVAGGGGSFTGGRFVLESNCPNPCLKGGSVICCAGGERWSGTAEPVNGAP